MNFLLLLLITLFLLLTITTVYFTIYKLHINKVVVKNSKSHIRMVPPYKILIIFAVAFLIFVVYIISVSITSHGGVGVTSLPLTEYVEEVESPEINELLAETNDDNKAYIFKHRNNTITHYLVYVPYAANNSEVSVMQSTNLFGETITLNIEAVDGDRGNHAILVTYTGENNPKLKISYGGHDLDCIISETKYSLELK